MNKPYYTLKIIESKWMGFRLDKYVMQKMNLPWSASHKLIRSKHIYVLRPDNSVVEKDIAYKLQFGDTLSVKDSSLDWVEKPNEFQHPKPLSLDISIKFENMIVYENEHIIVLNKEAGIPCQ